MQFIIVTGLSGAGKSRTICALEDIGFYCVDNLPSTLINTFYDLCKSSHDKNMQNVAIVTDIRDGGKFDSLFLALDSLKRSEKPYKILYLEASDNVIVRRYRESRRKHPLTETNLGSITQAINFEKNILKPVRERADYIIDTSLLSPAQLKQRISEMFLSNKSSSLMINCMSFGFKFGSPSEADIVFDVRCFPNPYYEDELRNLNGFDTPVRDYVLNNSSTQIFINKLFSLIDFMLPLYRNEGKSQLVIAIGCTGGKHRSVAIVQSLYEHLTKLNYSPSVYHRDIKKL